MTRLIVRLMAIMVLSLVVAGGAGIGAVAPSAGPEFFCQWAPFLRPLCGFFA